MPAQRLPWFKLWPEAVEHEKIAQLSDAVFRTWVYALAKAADQPIRWRFGSRRHAAQITGRALGHINILVSVRLLDDLGSEGVWVHDWRQWQDRYPSDVDREHSAKPPPTLRDDSANAPDTLRNETPNAPLRVRGKSKSKSREIDAAAVVPPGELPPRARSGGGLRRLNNFFPTLTAAAAAADSENLPDEVRERLAQPPIGATHADG